MSANDSSMAHIPDVTKAIQIIRGQKVLMDFDLAALYGIPVKVLVQAVHRNLSRFPPDFLLRLTKEEWSSLRSQIVTLESPKEAAVPGRPHQTPTVCPAHSPWGPARRQSHPASLP